MAMTSNISSNVSLAAYMVVHKLSEAGSSRDLFLFG